MRRWDRGSLPRTAAVRSFWVALLLAFMTVTIQVATATPGMLVLADAYADGWQAQLDGTAVPVYRTNYALRGVWVPAGIHQIRMVYRPQSLWIGGSLTVLTLSEIAVGLFAGRRSRRRNTSSRI